jgi:hypothetical protein
MFALQLVLLLTVLALAVALGPPPELFDELFTADRDRVKHEIEMEQPCIACKSGRCWDCHGTPCIHWPCFAEEKDLDHQDYDLN